MSKRLRTRSRHPAELAADVVEQVLATDGDMYLDTHEHHLSWWQLSLLDVKAFTLLCLLLLVALVGLTVWLAVLAAFAAVRWVRTRSVKDKAI